MSRPLRVEFPGALYLVTAKALPRQKIYRDAEEADDFLRRLVRLGENFGVLFHGFCLLPNHYHLLIETPHGDLSRALHRLNAGYTATVNARRSRKGPLLQSRYRAVLLDDDPWLPRLSVYLHLNPVRKKLCRLPWQYRWSSARFFAAPEQNFPYLETARVFSLAGGEEAYRTELEAGVEAPPSAPWSEVWKQAVLGGVALRNRVLAATEGRNAREVPGFSIRRTGQLDLDSVLHVVAEYTGIPEKSVCSGKYQRVLARKVAMYLARRYTRLTLREIGEGFGVDYTTVHMAARRVEELRGEDPGVDEFLHELEQVLQAQTARSSSAAKEDTREEKNVPQVQSPKPKRSRRKKEGGEGDVSAQLKLF